MDRLLVEVRATGDARALGRRVTLAPDREISVGRSSPSDLVVDDDQLSGRHFSVSWDGEVARLRDRRSITGTSLQGVAVGEAQVELPHGAWIHAGRTDFMVYREGMTIERRRELCDLSATASAAYQAVSREPYPLYAVLDCARDARILPLLREAVDERRCLFEGSRGYALVESAPHLVAFRDDSPLLRVLLGIGWGRRFGIWLTSARPFEELRRHFRRLLMVLDEERNERVYFRYYDPSVLRTFLTAATPGHRSLMFGPVSAYLLESAERNVERLVDQAV